MSRSFVVRTRSALAGAAVLLVSSGGLPWPSSDLMAQGTKPAPDARGRVVILKDKDTVAVEQFSRETGLLTGTIVQPNGVRTEYLYLLRADNTIEHADVVRRPKQGAGVSMSLDFGTTSVQVLFTAAGESQKADFTSPNRSTPFFVLSFALAEQILRATPLAVGQTAKLTGVRLGTGDTATMTVSRFHADSASLAMPDLGIKVALSPTGDVIGGAHLTQPWIVQVVR